MTEYWRESVLEARRRTLLHRARPVYLASQQNRESDEPEAVDGSPLVFLVGVFYGAIVCGLVGFMLGRAW